MSVSARPGPITSLRPVYRSLRAASEMATTSNMPHFRLGSMLSRTARKLG
jgi:hypothetical protein